MSAPLHIPNYETLPNYETIPDIEIAPEDEVVRLPDNEFSVPVFYNIPDTENEPEGEANEASVPVPNNFSTMKTDLQNKQFSFNNCNNFNIIFN